MGFITRLIHQYFGPGDYAPFHEKLNKLEELAAKAKSSGADQKTTDIPAIDLKCEVSAKFRAYSTSS